MAAHLIESETPSKRTGRIGIPVTYEETEIDENINSGEARTSEEKLEEVYAEYPYLNSIV